MKILNEAEHRLTQKKNITPSCPLITYFSPPTLSDCPHWAETGAARAGHFPHLSLCFSFIVFRLLQPLLSHRPFPAPNDSLISASASRVVVSSFRSALPRALAPLTRVSLNSPPSLPHSSWSSFTELSSLLFLFYFSTCSRLLLSVHAQ